MTELDRAWVHAGDGSIEIRTRHEGVLAFASVPSPARPDSNEDHVLVMPTGSDGVLLAVSDGCGGMPAGDRASALAIEALAGSVADADDGDLVASILAGFDMGNEAVADLRVGAGATLTAVLVSGSVARAFYAGDSPAAVVGHRSVIRFATLPHSLVGFGVEAGLLSEHDAVGHEDSGVVLNVLGFPEMFVHVGPPVPLRPMDTILVASDGLSDNLTMDRIAALCRVGGAADALDSLLGEAGDAMIHAPSGHPDDLSIALFRPTRRRDDLAIDAFPVESRDEG